MFEGFFKDGFFNNGLTINNNGKLKNKVQLEGPSNNKFRKVPFTPIG